MHMMTREGAVVNSRMVDVIMALVLHSTDVFGYITPLHEIRTAKIGPVYYTVSFRETGETWAWIGTRHGIVRMFADDLCPPF